MTPELQNTLAMLAQKLGTSVEHYEGQYDPVCECFEQEDAQLICNALNETQHLIGRS